MASYPRKAKSDWTAIFEERKQSFALKLPLLNTLF